MTYARAKYNPKITQRSLKKHTTTVPIPKEKRHTTQIEKQNKCGTMLIRQDESNCTIQTFNGIELNKVALSSQVLPHTPLYFCLVILSATTNFSIFPAGSLGAEEYEHTC